MQEILRGFKLLLSVTLLILPVHAVASSSSTDFLREFSEIDRQQQPPIQTINHLLPLRERALKLGGSALFHYSAALGTAYLAANQMQKAMNNFHVADLHASGKDLLSDRYHYMLDAWAFSYWKSGDLATAKKTLGRLYDVIELSDHKAAFLAATNTEMFIEISQDNWNRAVALGDRALALIDSDSIEFVNEQMRYFEMGRILAGVARLHYEFNPEKAITLHKRSLEISYASNNVLGIETDLHHLAILHLKTVDLEQARKYIDELIAASKLSGQKTGLLSAYTNLSHLHLLKTENKEAQRALLRAELYLEPNVVPALKEYYVLQAARLYQASADFEKALEIMEENKKLFANSNAPSVRRLPYLDLLASIYYELGMTEQALAIQARYHDLVKKLQQPKLSKATVSRNN